MAAAAGIAPIDTRSVDSLAHEIDGYGKALDNKSGGGRKSTRQASGRRHQSSGRRGESPLRAGASLQLSKDLN